MNINEKETKEGKEIRRERTGWTDLLNTKVRRHYVTSDTHEGRTRKDIK